MPKVPKVQKMPKVPKVPIDRPIRSEEKQGNKGFQSRSRGRGNKKE